jgi:hypothetical protein
MGERFRWFGGGGDDPLDHGRNTGVEPDQQPDPRPEGRDRAVVAAEVEFTLQDPLQILLNCEAEDEAMGCAPGTHFNEHCRRISKPTT